MKLFVSPAHSSLLLTIGTISCRIWIWRLGVYFVADEFNVGLNVDSKPLCFFTIDPSTHGSHDDLGYVVKGHRDSQRMTSHVDSWPLNKKGSRMFKVQPPLFCRSWGLRMITIVVWNELKACFLFGGLMTPSTRIRTEPFFQSNGRSRGWANLYRWWEFYFPFREPETPNPFQLPQEITRIQEISWWIAISVPRVY